MKIIYIKIYLHKDFIFFYNNKDNLIIFPRILILKVLLIRHLLGHHKKKT